MIKRSGRPYNNELRSEVTKITFKVDAETLAVLEAVEAALPPNIIRGRRSIALRQLILASARKS